MRLRPDGTQEAEYGAVEPVDGLVVRNRRELRFDVERGAALETVRSGALEETAARA